MPRSGALSPSEIEHEQRERCGGVKQSDKQPCMNMAGAGTPHPGYGYCKHHGGNTQAGLKAGAREAGRDLIRQFKADQDLTRHRFGGSRKDPSISVLTPEQALIEEVRRSAAMVRFLEERIGDWIVNPHEDQLLTEIGISDTRRSKKSIPEMKRAVDRYLTTLEKEGPEGIGDLPELVQVNPDTGISSGTNKKEWLVLYREERMHLARVSKMALDAGVAQRLVTLAEDQGRILSSALRVVLQALSLSPDQQRLVPLIVPTVLRSIAADQPLPTLVALHDLVNRANTTPAIES